MKQQMKTIFGMLRSVLLAVFTVAMIFGPSAALAATNTANWDIGGTAQTAATITINSYANGSVTLTKLAFLTDGTQLLDGATVPQGTEVRFVLAVANGNTFQMNDISLNDDLAPAGFTKVAGDFSHITIAGTGLTASVIYNEVTGAGAGTPLTATAAVTGDDIASFVGTTVQIGTTAGDTQLDVAGTSTWAIIFNATAN